MARRRLRSTESGACAARPAPAAPPPGCFRAPCWALCAYRVGSLDALGGEHPFQVLGNLPGDALAATHRTEAHEQGEAFLTAQVNRSTERAEAVDDEAVRHERDPQTSEPVLVLCGETKEDLQVGPNSRLRNTEVLRGGAVGDGFGAVTL